MSRAALASPHPTAFVTVSGQRRALLDVAATGSGAAPGRSAGSDDDAEAVLLVPGFTGSKEDFGPLLDGIAASGRRAVAIDLAGQYESDGSTDPADYAPDVLSRDLPLILGELGIAKAHLVGHSYGGLVSRAAVIADVAPWLSLTLLCSGPAALQGKRRADTDLVAQLAAVMELPALYDGMLDYWSQHGQSMPSEEGLPFQRARFASGQSAAIVGMAHGVLEEPDRVDTLGAAAATVGLPLHVVFGDEDDAWTPAEQTSMAARLGVTPHVVAGAGHSPAWENPAATLEVLLSLWSPAGG